MYMTHDLTSSSAFPWGKTAFLGVVLAYALAFLPALAAFAYGRRVGRAPHLVTKSTLVLKRENS